LATGEFGDEVEFSAEGLGDFAEGDELHVALFFEFAEAGLFDAELGGESFWVIPRALRRLWSGMSARISRARWSARRIEALLMVRAHNSSKVLAMITEKLYNINVRTSLWG